MVARTRARTIRQMVLALATLGAASTQLAWAIGPFTKPKQAAPAKDQARQRTSTSGK